MSRQTSRLGQKGVLWPQRNTPSFPYRDTIHRSRRHMAKPRLRATHVLDRANTVQVCIPMFSRISNWLIHTLFFLRPYGLNVPYRRFFTEFERISVELQGKPHWAKTHSLTPAELSLMYPKFPEFVKVLESVDPAGLFRNEYVRRHIFGETGGDVHGRIFKRRA